MQVPLEMVDTFKKGTTPDGFASDAEMRWVESVLVSTIERTKEDFKRGLFSEYHEYTTSARVTLTTINDAIPFNLFHEGLHLGAIIVLLNHVR